MKRIHVQIENNAAVIQRNLPFLSKRTCNFRPLMIDLVSKDVMIEAQKQTALSKSNDVDIADELYTAIMKNCTDENFNHLIEAFNDSGNHHCSEQLKQSSEDSISTLDSKTELLKSPFLEKWWPAIKPLTNSFVERKLDGNLTVQKIKDIIENDSISIRTAVLTQKVSGMATLSGMGGIGKTTTAKWFGHKYENDYAHIIWIDCGEGNTERSLKSFADQLGVRLLDGENRPRPMTIFVPEIYRNLKNICLFIFDNVENYQSIKDVLPRDSIHKSLITSRYQEWGNESEFGSITVLPLDVFSPEDAEQFLFKNNLAESSEQSRKQLASELGCLPLAMRLAVVMIQKLNCTVAAYLEKLKVNTEKILLKQTGLDSYQNMSIYRSFEVTIDVINDNIEFGALAQKILNIFGFVAPDGIEEEMIIELVNCDETKIDIPLALMLLKDYSLISSTTQTNNYNIHRLLQEVVRVRLGTNCHPNLLRSLLTSFWKIYSNKKDEYQTHIWMVWEHALKYDQLVDDFLEFFLEIINQRRFSNYLLDSNSMEFFRISLPHLDRVLDHNCPTALSTKFFFCKQLFEDANYKDAFCRLESILNVLEEFKLQIKTFPKEPVDTYEIEDSKRRCYFMTAWYNMATVQDRLGNFQAAVSLYKKLIIIRDSVWEFITSTTFSGSLGSSIEDTEIIFRATELNEIIPTKVGLQCKVVTLLISLNKLPEALQQMEEAMAATSNGANVATEYIFISVLKLILAIRSQKDSGHDITHISQRVFHMFQEMCIKLIKWNDTLVYYNQISLVYWDVIIRLADWIALTIIESGEYDKAEIVYQLVHNIQRRVGFIGRDSTYREVQLPDIGAPVISLLLQLHKNSEVINIRKWIEVINRLGGSCKGDCLIRRDYCNTQENSLVNSRYKPNNKFCNFIQVNTAYLFTGFKSTVNPNCLKEITLECVDFYKCELVHALAECINLESLTLKFVAILGWCTQRAHLPNLTSFVIESLHCGFHPESLSEIDKNQIRALIAEIYSFFYKDNKDWKVEDIGSLKMKRHKIVLIGEMRIIDINHL